MPQELGWEKTWWTPLLCLYYAFVISACLREAILKYCGSNVTRSMWFKEQAQWRMSYGPSWSYRSQFCGFIMYFFTSIGTILSRKFNTTVWSHFWPIGFSCPSPTHSPPPQKKRQIAASYLLFCFVHYLDPVWLLVRPL